MKLNSTFVKLSFAFLAVLITASITTQAQRGRSYYRYAKFYPSYGQRFISMPGPYVSIRFGGVPYYYSGGLFYRPYGSYFQVAFPPFGLRVGILPSMYHPMMIAGNPYYYANGIFYRPSASTRDYEVVQAPVGAEVPSLPAETKTMVIDGEKFYSLNGTYFKDVVKPNGELWYKVVGKNGVLNTFKNDPQNNPSYQQPAYPQQAPQNAYPQTAPQQTQPYNQPQQEEQPAAQQAPVQQPAAVMPAGPAQPSSATQSSSIQPVNGVREAVRRNPQAKPSEETPVAGTDSTQWTAPDLVLHDNPGLGWVVDRLPKDCKTVTINNKKYFLSPDNTYYEEFIDGRQVRYKVVGK